jgi:hypothetical protein
MAANEYDELVKSMDAAGKLQRSQHTQADFDRLSQASPDWIPATAAAASLFVLCVVLVTLRKRTTFRLFGSTPLERLGGLVFWPCALILLAAFVGDGIYRGFTQVASDLAAATPPDARGEDFLVLLVHGVLIGGAARFIALPFMRWVFTGHVGRS